MELLRALAALAEAPTPELAPLASRLDLGELPPGHEHTELFAFQLVPYASIYLGQEGRVGGEARDRILGFWRVLGREPAGEGDHLTLMLASYAELCEAEEAASTSGDEEALRAARHHRTVFLDEHLLSWLPAYLLRVRQIAGGFYRSWAELLAELLSREASDRSVAATEPMHFRLSAPFPAPDAELDTVLDALVAPVRSGLLLTRRDLADAASELDIGSRMGERRYMLEAMLRQRPRAVLTWLAGHCERSIEIYSHQPLPLHDALEPWRSRAAIARERLNEVLAAGRAETHTFSAQ